MVSGLRSTALTEVADAAAAPIRRSIRSGNATTLIMKATSANRKPTALPTRIIRCPASVVSTIRAKSLINSGTT